MSQPVTVWNIGEIVGRCEIFDGTHDGGDKSPWRFRHEKVTSGWHVWLEKYRLDVDTGEYGWGVGRILFIPVGYTDSQLAKACGGLALAFVEHEMRHHFHYDGSPIFHPDADVNVMAEAVKPSSLAADPVTP